MNSKFVSTLGFALVAMVAITLTQAQPDDGVATTTGSTTRRTEEPTERPTCRPAGTCPPGSPPICARNRGGMCQRFANECQLRQANCAAPVPSNNWRKTKPASCGNMRPGAAIARCLPTAVCRSPLPTCPPPTDAPKLCVRTNNRRQCRIVANACVLNNLNCRSKTTNWSVVKSSNCRRMNVGEKAKSCTRLAKRSLTMSPKVASNAWL